MTKKDSNKTKGAVATSSKFIVKKIEKFIPVFEKGKRPSNVMIHDVQS